MNLSVTSRQIDVSPALRERTELRLERLFSKYFGSAISAKVTFDRDGDQFKSNLEAHVGGSIRMNASAKHQDAYTALDVAAQNLAKRLRRQKRKLRDDHGVSLNDAVAPDLDASATLNDYAGYDDEGMVTAPVIVSEKNDGIRTLSVAQAVDQLSMGPESAVFFINSKTGRSNMLYRRSDGNLGWVEPKDHH